MKGHTTGVRPCPSPETNSSASSNPAAQSSAEKTKELDIPTVSVVESDHYLLSLESMTITPLLNPDVRPLP